METGVDFRLLIALAATIVLFVVVPGVAIEYERRKRQRTGSPMTGYPGLD
jgi:hypothetical protein